MPNPMISAGVLNKVRGAIKFTSHPELNVSASYLAKEGIGLIFQGNIVNFLPVLTGVVQSPEPYIIMQATVNLVRSQALATQFRKQWELNAAIGDAMVYSDSPTFGDFSLLNTGITNVRDMNFAGGDPGVALTITGTYYVNSEMWEL